MMMNRMLVLLVCAGASVIAWSQADLFDLLDERQYHRTPLSTALLGSSYNGSTIVVYGEGGVIVRTRDLGAHWEQFNLPDSLHVLFITNDGNRFVGLCHRWFGIVSDDNGQSWSTRPLADTADYWQVIEEGDYLLALARDRVSVYDKELRLVDTYWLNPPDTSDVHALAVTNRYIVYSPAKGTLVVLDREQRTTQRIDLLAKGCSACSDIYQLITDASGMVYLLSTPDRSTGAAYLISYDPARDILGDTIPTGIRNFGREGKLLIRSGKLHLLRAAPSSIASYDSLVFAQLDPNTRQFVQLNQSPLERYLRRPNIINVRALTERIIVAVGQSKFIAASFDGGVHWSLVSWCPEGGLYLFGDTIRILSSRAFIRTTDGGVTWQSQLLDPYRPILGPQTDPSQGIIPTYLFDYRTAQIAYALVTPGMDSLVSERMLYSTDGGETFRYPLRPYQWNQLDGLVPFRYRGNYHLMARWEAPPAPRQRPIPWTQLSGPLDDTLGGDINYAVLRNIAVQRLLPAGDTLWAIVTDSSTGTGVTHDGRYNILLCTGDLRQWQYVGTTPVMQSSLVGAFFHSGHLFLWTPRTAVRFNPRTGTSSVILQTSQGPSIVVLRAWGPKLHAVLGTAIFSPGRVSPDVIYEWFVSNNPLADSVQWQQVPLSRYYISGIWSADANSSIYIRVEDKHRRIRDASMLFRLQAVNPAPVETPGGMAPNAVMWLSPPMPHPARDRVSMTLYIDQRLRGEGIRFRIYDVFGSERTLQPLVQSLNAYSLSVTFDADALPAGVYVVIAECGAARVARQVVVVR